MSLPEDLLDLARRTADPGRPGAPRQADLRRAISTTYYALFHKIVEEATRRFVGRAPDRQALRQSVFGRAFDHAEMRDCAKSFGARNPANAFKEALGDVVLGAALVHVADCFVELQEERHKADYHSGIRFTRPQAIGLVEQTEEAFRCLDSIRGTLEADVFLGAMLLGKRPVRR